MPSPAQLPASSSRRTQLRVRILGPMDSKARSSRLERAVNRLITTDLFRRTPVPDKPIRVEQAASALLDRPQPSSPLSEPDHNPYTASDECLPDRRTGSRSASIASSRNGSSSSSDSEYVSAPLSQAAAKGTPVPMLWVAPDMNSKDDRNGRTPLSEAAANGRSEAVQLLLAAHADVDSKDGCGGTPLSNAAAHSHSEVVQLLLAAHCHGGLRHGLQRLGISLN